MDVARQLIQLSGESDGHHHHRDDDDDDNNNNSCAKGKAEQSKVGDASSTNTIGETFEEDGICWPSKRRFRSIYHLYSSTRPVIVANAKRRKFAV
jgi:cell division septation protein DedD